MSLPEKFETFFELAEKEKLYFNLIVQLKKDFLRAQINIEIEDSIKPIALKNKIQETIESLIQYRFNEYINLLYIIDVSESKVKQVNSNDLNQYCEHVTFLILQREWKKVYYKSKF